MNLLTFLPFYGQQPMTQNTIYIDHWRQWKFALVDNNEIFFCNSNMSQTRLLCQTLFHLCMMHFSPNIGSHHDHDKTWNTKHIVELKIRNCICDTRYFGAKHLEHTFSFLLGFGFSFVFWLLCWVCLP